MDTPEVHLARVEIDPLRPLRSDVRESSVEFLRLRARENDSNLSVELRRILREAAEREAASKKTPA